MGVCDTACRCSVAGGRWHYDYRLRCEKAGLSEFIKEEKESEPFRFGDGGILKSTFRATVPAVVCGIPSLITFSVVPSDTFGLLLGCDSHAEVHLWKHELRIGAAKYVLHDSFAGHPAVDFHPDSWFEL